MFIGSALQLDYEGNSSTVTKERLSSPDDTPNTGHSPDGRRHPIPA